ncbi:hypothetical protein G6F27_013856 [Rhizopus arrhizus]|nr:hypothetical protein G6F27_013856 [Rhizopus arrhizus]
MTGAVIGTGGALAIGFAVGGTVVFGVAEAVSFYKKSKFKKLEKVLIKLENIMLDLKKDSNAFKDLMDVEIRRIPDFVTSVKLLQQSNVSKEASFNEYKSVILETMDTLIESLQTISTIANEQEKRIKGLNLKPQDHLMIT